MRSPTGVVCNLTPYNLLLPNSSNSGRPATSKRQSQEPPTGAGRGFSKHMKESRVPAHRASQDLDLATHSGEPNHPAPQYKWLLGFVCTRGSRLYVIL